MNNKKSARKRVVAVVVIFILILSMILPFFMMFFTVEAGTNDFDVTAKIGVHGFYKIDEATNLEFIVANNGDDFRGEIQIRTNIFQKRLLVRNAVYSFAVDLPRGAVKKISLDVIIDSISKEIKMSIVDEKGKIVQNEIFPLEVISPQTVAIGVFSDHKESLNYLNNFSYAALLNLQNPVRSSAEIDGQAKRNELFFFGNSELPDSKEDFSFFDVIIINDFDVSFLSDQELRLIEKWTMDGNLLIIGAGRGVEKLSKAFNLGFFEDIYHEKKLASKFGLLDVGSAQLGEVQISDLEYYPMNREYNGDLFYLRDFSDELIVEGNIVLDSNSVALDGMGAFLFSDDVKFHPEKYSVIAHEEDSAFGKILYLSIDLAATASKNAEFSQMLERIIATYLDKVERDVKDAYYYGRNSIDREIELFPVANATAITGIFTLVLAYIVIIGPIAFFGLKRKGKLDLAWILIPICALITTAIVFVMSLTGDFSGPIVNNFNIIAITSGSEIWEVEKKFVAFSPKSGTVNVTMQNGLIPKNYLKPNSQHYYSFRDDVKYANTEKDVVKLTIGEKNSLDFYDAESWSDFYFDDYQIIEFAGDIEANFEVQKGQLVGEVKNNTGHDLNDVVVLYQGTIIVEKELKTGEMVKVSAPIDSANYGDFNSVYSLLQKAFQYEKLDVSNIENAVGWKENELKKAMIEYASDEFHFHGGRFKKKTAYLADLYEVDPIYERDFPMPPIIFAFSDENIFDEKIEVSGSVPKMFHKNIFMSMSNLRYGNNEVMSFIESADWRNILSEDVTLKSYWDSSIEVEKAESGEIIFNYEIPKRTNVKAFVFLNNLKDVLIYNAETDNWEELISGTYQNDNGKYVSEERIFLKIINVEPLEHLTFPTIQMFESKGGAR